ncbi:SH3 domain-containing protein [Rhodoblastus sp.]|uniref:SH3 domain-containing protein n=1 Tax=Rhodoblastus sp. TaxID=1962975 RepID=UPI003F96FE9E
MSSRLLPVLAGVAMAATASSAFAFGAMVSAPTALRTHATHRAAVIEVVPANGVVDMARCYRGWCEAAYGGQMGYVHTPLLVSATPSTDVGPIGTVLTLPFTVVGGVLGAPAPIVAGTR